ncbi:tonsoku-like protein [Daphnia carinata]|uniref:tonsoku-like protein n=1 Tax=Daphnia carinata TaxID=120202 RepID=UPI00257A38C0|nr:tonsoku-like protein [Daphnia carinata]
MNSYTFKDVSKLLKVKAKAKSKGELRELASCCNVLGELYQQQGKYEDAIAEHEEERKICKQLNDCIGIGIAHRKIGEALNELGQYENALKHQQNYLALANSVDNKLEIQRALATIGRTHFCHAEALTTNNRVLYDKALDSSKLSYQKSLELCERLKEVVSERDYMQMNSRLLLNLGLVCDLQQQDSAAVNYFKKASYIADKYNFREDLHRCHYSLALFYQRRKNFSQAKREAEMAEKVAFQLKDKALICDDLALKAQLFVIMADFESARRYLLKAYRQKSPVIQDHERIENDLRSAIKLCKLQDMCCILSANEEEKLLRLHEKMGDLCSSLKAYPRAIDFYLKMLTKAQELRWSAKDINPIYVSLSQTYMDVKDYKNAIKYYKKELENYEENPAESCRTLLNIANALEEDGATYYELEPLYQQALDLAVKAENPRLKATTLNSLAVLHEMNGYIEKSQEAMASVNQICSDHNIDLDDESEAPESQTIRNNLFDFEDEIDLDEIYDDESDEESESLDNNRGRRRPKRNIEKLNVKGETALHRACIKQDIDLVRLLLQQKHKVNVRDNCGWTPLHEACNYGDVEIVQLLIDNGATVNDRGGKHCEGVTPLHDAASCGHIDVMDALLRNGANPLSKTDAGESVYECLLKWRLRTGGDLDSATLKECLNMERKLSDSMRKANHVVPSMKEIEHKHSSTSALIPEEDITGNSFQEVELTRVGPSEPEMGGPAKFRESKDKRLASSAAQKEYAEAMKVIGSSSSARRSTAVSGPTKRSRIHQPALVLEEELVDEWIENDLPSPTRKSSKKSNFTFPVHKPNNQSDKEKTPTSTSSRLNKHSSRLSLSNRRKSGAPSLDFEGVTVSDDDIEVEVMLPSAKRAKPSPSFIHTSDDSNDRASPILSVSKRPKKPVQLSMYDFAEVNAHTEDNIQAPKKAVNKSFSSVQQQNPSTSVLKLYVRIQDKVLLIPVERSKSVQWLSDEAARRYYNMTGLNPVLSLHTMDGAVLNGEDEVTLILQDGDKIVGQMVKWDLQPLPERYSNLCCQLEVVRLGEVDSVLTNAQTGGKLSLNLPLGPSLLPVVKALRYQESLWDLDLSSSKLDDHVLQSLCEALSTLPHLVNLSLKGNLITAAGLTRLAESLQEENVTGMKKLQRINLSYNPIGDGASYPLTTCFQHMSALRSLQMESCDLTDRFLSDRISPVLKRKKLEDLSIGFNEFSSSAISSWMQVLDFSCLKSLSLQALSCDRLVNILCSSIQAVESCTLIEMDLSHCNLTDSCIERLGHVFSHTPQLKKLTLKNNNRLGIDAVADLLDCCRMKWVHIEEVDLLGCALTRSDSKDNGRCVESLRSFLAWSKSLHRLSLSFSRHKSDPTWIPFLTEVWISGHDSEVLVKQPTEHQLILTTPSCS